MCTTCISLRAVVDFLHSEPTLIFDSSYKRQNLGFYNNEPYFNIRIEDCANGTFSIYLGYLRCLQPVKPGPRRFFLHENLAQFFYTPLSKVTPAVQSYPKRRYFLSKKCPFVLNCKILPKWLKVAKTPLN